MDDEKDIFMMIAMRENVLHTFFPILWGKCRARKTLNNVRIPDTVVFSHSRVADWFFTSKDGVIRKKGHSKLSSANVIEQFEKRAKRNKSSVVAVVFERDVSREDGLKTKHLDYAGLSQFLGEGGGSGTLQAFVEPKAESGAVRNNEVALNWTPNVFYVEKKTNTSDITKEYKGSLDERTTVDETAKNVTVHPLVSTRVTAELERVCQEIALHLELVFSVRLASISLHCKVDAFDQLWIMYCSAMRVVSLAVPSRGVAVSLAQGRAEKCNESAVAANNASANARAATEVRSKSAVGSSPQPTAMHESPAKSGRSSSWTSRQPPTLRQNASSILPGKRAVSPASEPESDVGSSDFDATLRSNPAGRVSGGGEAETSVAGGGEAYPRVEQQRCKICLAELNDGARMIPKRHVLFPLSIISFFASHPPGTRYVDVVESSREPASIPEFVLLVHPELSLGDYRALRRDFDWLSEPLEICDPCADGLRDVVASLQLERDGSILVPTKRQADKPAPRGKSQTAR